MVLRVITPTRGAVPAQFHESTLVEVLWTIIPMLILIGMAVPATGTLVRMYDARDAEFDDQGHRLSVALAIRLSGRCMPVRFSLRAQDPLPKGELSAGGGQSISVASLARRRISTSPLADVIHLGKPNWPKMIPDSSSDDREAGYIMLVAAGITALCRSWSRPCPRRNSSNGWSRLKRFTRNRANDSRASSFLEVRLYEHGTHNTDHDHGPAPRPESLVIDPPPRISSTFTVAFIGDVYWRDRWLVIRASLFQFWPGIAAGDDFGRKMLAFCRGAG